MNTLSLENINKHAPYGVRHRENDCYSFYFETDFGLKYTIHLVTLSYVKLYSPSSRSSSQSMAKRRCCTSVKQAMKKRDCVTDCSSDGSTPMSIVIFTSYVQQRVCLTA